MINLDHQLLRNARRLITGDNVHRMQTLILLYENSVRLHNQGHPKHRVYHDCYERLLREFVGVVLSTKLTLEYTQELRFRAGDIQERSNQLRKEIDRVIESLARFQQNGNREHSPTAT